MRVSARPMLKGRCRLGTPAQILNARSDRLGQHLRSMCVDPARFKALRAIPQDDVSLFGTEPRAFGLPTRITAVLKLCRPPPTLRPALGGAGARMHLLPGLANSHRINAMAPARLTSFHFGLPLG